MFGENHQQKFEKMGGAGWTFVWGAAVSAVKKRSGVWSFVQLHV